MTIIPFMRPRYTGARFDEHAIPLELLSELAVIEEMIVEVAKWAFLQDNRDRKRSPRGFTDGIEIKLAGLEEGSSIAVLGLVIAASTLSPSESQVYFEKARDSIASAIHAASADEPVLNLIPEKAIGYFDRIGRRLRDGEAIEFTMPNGHDTARLTKETRRKLLLASANVKELTEDVVLRASIPAVDQGDKTFEIELIDGRKIKSPLESQHFDAVIEAVRGYKSGARVILHGVGRFSRSERLLKLDSVKHISPLDRLDVTSRLEELAQLKDGWFEGAGRALNCSGIQWLSRTFDSNLCDELPLPYVYPTPEGGIQMEWGLNGTEVSMVIDLNCHTAEWHSFNLSSDEEQTRSLNLDEIEHWKWISEKIRQLNRGSA
jgi:hypothetical protein